METDRDKAARDQQFAEFGDAMPAVWWRMFSNMKKDGFNEEQAMRLLCAFIASIGRRGE